MRGEAGVIAVDWGTTNRRVYVIGPDGKMRDRLTDGLGILAVPPAGFPAAIAELRERFGHAPMILAGMVGSDRGWVKAAYLSCPADMNGLTEGVLHIADADAFIVPGLRGDEDVMRGEEVQLFGAVTGSLVSPDSRICHPGTLAKWAVMRAGAVESFRTVMTGELFAILRKHGILAPMLAAEISPGDPFRAGVRRSLDGCELTADLFSVRARVVLGSLPEVDAASYASGLLIGADIRIGLDFVGRSEPVALIGDAVLTGLYAAALGEAGQVCTEIDGEAAFVAGIKTLAEKLS